MVVKNIRYREYEPCTLDLYLPNGQAFPTVLYFHGGGLENGTKADKSYVEIAESFASRGYAFVSVEYRMLTQGARFPDFVEDCASAVAWVKTHIKEYGGSGVLFVSGQSAGAWLALMLCLDKKYLSAVGIDSLEIEGWLIDSAQTTAHFNVLKSEGYDSRLQRINEFAPQYFVDENTRFSKILLLFYEEDMPCRPEQNMLFYKSILQLNENADITWVKLPGGHCHGSIVRDNDGEYAFVKEAFKWLER